MAINKDKMLNSLSFSDQRGELYINKIKGVEFNVIFTKAGHFRGGDYHTSKQYNVILKGKIEITLRKNKKDVAEVYGPNELIIIPENIPHLFRALTDVVFIEWKVTPLKPRYYGPYRKIINQHLEKRFN